MSASDVFRYVVAGLIAASLLGALGIWSVAAYRSRSARRGRRK